MLESSSPPRPLETMAALAAVVVATLIALIDFLRIHPGYSSIDESFVLIYTQLMLEGKSAPLIAMTGSGMRTLEWLSAKAFGSSLMSLHLPALAAFLLENFLLWRLVRKLYGSRAALGAVFFNAVCAFSFIRARSLLSFSVFPCEFLLVLNLLWLRPSRARSLFAGLLAGLFTLDYEGWLMGSAIVAVLAFSGRPWKDCLGGLALGLAISLWLSAAHLASWLEIRSTYSGGGLGSMPREFFQNSRAFLFGGETVSYLGPDGHPAIPRWSWPFVIAGAWRLRGDTKIWIWALLGFAPFALTTYGSEPNRAIAAWPALALICGAGWQWIWQRMPYKRLHGMMILAILILGLADESQAMQRSQNNGEALCYGRSQSLIQASGKIGQMAGTHGLRLLSSLEFNHGPELRFLCGDLKSEDHSPVLAWISDGLLIQFDGHPGAWWSAQSNKKTAPEYFVPLQNGLATRLSIVDAQIRGFQSRLPFFEQKIADAMIFRWLDENPKMDPWVRTALWSRVMHDLALNGRMDEKRLAQLLGEKLVSADPLYQPGIILTRTRPAMALRMLKAAARMDPRRQLDAETMRRIQLLAGPEKKP